MSKPKIIKKEFLIQKYINEKLSAIEIAEICDCSSTTVYKYMEKYNMKRRTIQDALFGKFIGIKNPNFKHGNKVKKYFECKECRKSVTHGCFSGLCKSCSHKGERAYNYIDGYSSKYIEHYCIDCKITKISCNSKNNRCKSCNAKWQVGENNPNWVDGRSFLPYSIEWTKKLKESIRKRDSYTCQNCGMTEEEQLKVVGKVLNVHHIDYDKMNCKEDNLITTCLWCNSRANSNRDYWYAFYLEKIKDLISK